MNRGSLLSFLSRAIALIGMIGAGLFGTIDDASATPYPYCLNPSSQWATVCDIRFDVGNAALVNAGFTGPYVNGVINLSASHNAATFTFNSATQVVGGITYTYKFGDIWANLSNYTGSNLGISAVSFSGNNNSTSYTPDWNGKTNVSEFGDFNIGADSQGGANAAVTFLQFTLTFNDASTWSDAAHVLALNNNGADGAGHIFVWAPTGTDAVVTGFAGWPCDNEPTCGPPVQTAPAPGALVLLGFGLFGFGYVSRRRR